jgi:hypothetical protein
MTEQRQEGEYLRLSQEYWSIKAELASLFAALRRLGIEFTANAKTLKEKPDIWYVDPVGLCEEVQQGAKNANRLRELLGIAADNQAALDRYKGVFPPVPGSE